MEPTMSMFATLAEYRAACAALGTAAANAEPVGGEPDGGAMPAALTQATSKGDKDDAATSTGV